MGSRRRTGAGGTALEHRLQHHPGRAPRPARVGAAARRLGPTLEFEALLRVFASDSAGADDLRRLLEGVRTEMAAWQTFGNALGREIGTSGGPFPSRVHVNALVHRFLSYYVTAVHQWAEWALDEVKQWETTNPMKPSSGADVR